MDQEKLDGGGLVTASWPLVTFTDVLYPAGVQ
jgi:hypothetical protein